MPGSSYYSCWPTKSSDGQTLQTPQQQTRLLAFALAHGTKQQQQQWSLAWSNCSFDALSHCVYVMRLRWLRFAVLDVKFFVLQFDPYANQDSCRLYLYSFATILQSIYRSINFLPVNWSGTQVVNLLEVRGGKEGERRCARGTHKGAADSDGHNCSSRSSIGKLDFD